MGEEDRIFWSTLEWWKVVYDFYKNFQTIAFASIAVSGALLGGPFGHSISSKNGLLLKLLVLLSFVVAFAAFLFTSWKAIQGMSIARRRILHMENVTTEEERQTERDKEKASKEIWEATWRSYLVGICAFFIFAGTGVVLTGLF